MWPFKNSRHVHRECCLVLVGGAEQVPMASKAPACWMEQLWMWRLSMCSEALLILIMPFIWGQKRFQVMGPETSCSGLAGQTSTCRELPPAHQGRCKCEQGTRWRFRSCRIPAGPGDIPWLSDKVWKQPRYPGAGQ